MTQGVNIFKEMKTVRTEPWQNAKEEKGPAKEPEKKLEGGRRKTKRMWGLRSQ